MLELIMQRRMKERFKTHFGSTYDTFFDDDEQVFNEETFNKKKAKAQAEAKSDTEAEE